ncbi:MAG: ATP-binding protein [Terriglobia bacterium]|nr:ATP-binding protein [Terriglobia bacterium]
MSGRSRLIFRGTFAQTALLVSAALLVAQGIGFFLLVNERDRWRLLDAVQPAIERFAAATDDISKADPSKRMDIAFRLSRSSERFILGRESMIGVFKLHREPDLERKLSAALTKAGLHARAIQATSIGFADSPRQNPPQFPLSLIRRRGPPPWLAYPPPDGAGPRLPPPGFGPPHDDGLAPGGEHQEIDFAVQLPDGMWLNAQFPSNAPSAFFLRRLVLAELVLFAAVLSVTLLLAMRLARPMMRLATAADNLAPHQTPVPVAESGPSDIRAAIRSFNAMVLRVTELLREKDRMIGAIGHDLRTPLASLRLRAEAVESETEREKIIETIDDMTRMIDQILDLARLNHSGENFADVDIAALADSVVEEFRELGKNATFIDSPRTILRIQPFLVRRLLRNLIENGIKYGDRVEVSVERQSDIVSLVVADEGPGIPADALERVVEPFSRLELSRNKNTGGAGLGLSIAAGIARNQNAELTLENRQGGGLIAKVSWNKRSGARRGDSLSSAGRPWL